MTKFSNKKAKYSVGESNIRAMCPGHYLCLHLPSFPEIQFLQCVPFICKSPQSDLALKCLLNQSITAKNQLGVLPATSILFHFQSFLSSVLLCAGAAHCDTQGLSPMATVLSSLLAHSPSSSPAGYQLLVGLPHLPDSARAVLSDSPHKHHSLHSFT